MASAARIVVKFIKSFLRYKANYNNIYISRPNCLFFYQQDKPTYSIIKTHSSNINATIISLVSTDARMAMQ